MLALVIILLVSFVCYTNGRRAPNAVFLGIAAGLVALLVTQTSMNKVGVPSPTEIGSRALLFIGLAIEMALGVYLALMGPLRNQIVVEAATT